MNEQNFSSAAEHFEQILTELRKNAPAVGSAALIGKTPNRALKRAWSVLNGAGVELQMGNMNYRWRALHAANPKLGHSIEEVLVFGASLFSAISQKQSPESLKQDFLDIKQRFSKIIKETEAIATPQQERRLLSFFEKPAAENQKIELRLDALDGLLDEAHSRSRNLLHRTEKDLHIERAFHRAVEWYILALERANRQLEEATAPDGPLQIDQSLIIDLKNSLQIASTTTTANLAASDQFLRVKETLHNKSITFLTAHENTFTVIQGHLRSWKDIKNQTEALNALSTAVKAGSELMSSAAVGVEEPMKAWNPSFITPEALKALSESFGEYDNQVGDLVATLTEPQKASGPHFSRWDEWEDTKKGLLDPILEDALQSQQATSTQRSRPTLRKNTNQVSEVEVVEEAVAPQVSPVAAPQVEEVTSIRTTSKQWSPLEKIVANRAVQLYAAAMNTNISSDYLEGLGWDVREAVNRINSPLSALGADVANLNPYAKSAINYEMEYGDPENCDWSKVTQSAAMPYNDQEWDGHFKNMMTAQDDLDWSYMMQWNDLVYDLMIFEQDTEQKDSVLQGQTEEDQKIRAGLVDRINEFVSNPGVSPETIKSWGFSGLVLRYALALDMDSDKVAALWNNFDNPAQPVDWDGSLVKDWVADYPQDMQTSAAKKIWDDKNMSSANDRPYLVSSSQASDLIKGVIAASEKNKLTMGRKKEEKETVSATRPRM